MKKYIILLSAFFLFVACQREEVLAPAGYEQGFLAEVEDFAGATRTSLDGNNSIRWSEDDRVTVFQGSSAPDVFELSSESVGKTKGHFREVMTESDGFVSGNEIPDNVALYPYSEDMECTIGMDDEDQTYRIENVHFPASQYYQAESFPDDAFVMVAVTDGTDDRKLKFRNASGALRLRVKGAVTVSTISITGNDNEPLAGYATVIAYKDSSSPVVEKFHLVNPTVNLYCESGVRLDENTPTEFILALPPTDFEKGFTIRITDLNGEVYERVTEKRNSVRRSRILNMPEITFGNPGSSAGGNDYVDEYGVNHGQGVEIDGVVWAPVNCGYHATDFKYGKLYQWGRKYGQGYSGRLYDASYNVIGTYSDATVPTIVSGPVDLAAGQSKGNENIFYTYNSSPYDWLSPQNDELWNSGSESNPVKTEYDPCPAGWRVPTYAELSELCQNSSWTSEDGQACRWFSGASSFTENVPQVFFPAVGYLGYDGNAYDRGLNGYYWSSRPNDNFAYGLCFDISFAGMFDNYRANGYSVRCVQDDAELIPVSSLTLSKTSFSLDVAKTATLTATIVPSNANHQSTYWWSDNESVATVDQNGKVTAVSVGTATITAMAGMQMATCKVTVNSKWKNYVDEYGVNHGQGIEIDGVIWAPVNCGYHATDFKYGKLYQWGRKYGQGYSGDLYDVNGNEIGTYSDVTVPTVVSGPVSLSTGQSSSKTNVFYKNSSSPEDWLSPQNDELWNSGTEENPVKTEYDPCPSGWRVPTYAELNELCQNYSSWTSEEGQLGHWFSGASSYTKNVPQVFFPAAGYRSYAGSAYGRGDNGSYWSSRPYGDDATCLRFFYGNENMYNSYRALGFSVRCVQD